MKAVNVIGIGYIGLPTALMLAAHGTQVIGTDLSQERVDALNAGTLPFEEKGLPELFEQARARVSFSTEYAATDMYIITVQTPYDKVSKRIDARYIQSAVSSVLAVCDDDAVICVESTISPGTIDDAVRPLVEASGKTVRLAHTPERIVPGDMVRELVENSRTIGADDETTAALIEALYKTFCVGEIVKTDVRTAELSKVVENTFRDVNIAFANELSRICEDEGIDVRELIAVANHHPRVNILSPGPGVGGHCIGVDPWFLVGDHPDLAVLIHAARTVNDGQPAYVLQRLRGIMDGCAMQDFSRVGLYGLTYKPNVDDVRESPGLQLLEQMKAKGFGGAVCYDPHVKRAIVERQVFDVEEFLAACDVVVVLMNHKEIHDIADRLADKIVFDTCDALRGQAKYRL